MKLLIFNFMYYSISQLHRISRLCIVAVLKFVINQHSFFLFCFFSLLSILVVFLITCHLFFFFFLYCSFLFIFQLLLRRVEFRIMKNYAIPSFAYVGSAYRCVNY